jgi:hypothetical protein
MGTQSNKLERLCSMRINTLLLAGLAAVSLAACNPGGYQTSAAERTIGGALAGAVIADATGGSKTQGALIGAVAGGVSCGIAGLPACR